MVQTLTFLLARIFILVYMTGITSCNFFALDCLDYQNRTIPFLESFLANSTTICECGSWDPCQQLDEPACIDRSGNIRKNAEIWFSNACVKCTCVEGTVNCTLHDVVNSTDGLFEVNTTLICEHCVVPQQPQGKLRACSALFGIYAFGEQKIFECATKGLFIREIYRCNGVSECPDGSDEKDCADVKCTDEDGGIFLIKDPWGWIASPCTTCSCVRGLMTCERSLRVYFPAYFQGSYLVMENCKQPSCNILQFLRDDKSDICEACRWNGKQYDVGEHWKENGVDFYCSIFFQKVRPGCYVEQSRVKCTSVIKGALKLAVKANSELFVCESGDEIRSFYDRCNLQADCEDKSDERDCTQFYCKPAFELGILWPRTPLFQEISKECSSINSSWTGKIIGNCSADFGPVDFGPAVWYFTCECEKIHLVQYFNLKIKEVNETNLMNLSMELSSSASSFINKKAFHEMLTDLFYNVTKRLPSLGSRNASVMLRYCKYLIETVKTNAHYDEKNTFCQQDLGPERGNLLDEVGDFLLQAPQNTSLHDYGQSLPSEFSLKDFFHRSYAFQQGSVSSVIVSIQAGDQRSLQLNSAPLLPEEAIDDLLFSSYNVMDASNLTNTTINCTGRNTNTTSLKNIRNICANNKTDPQTMLQIRKMLETESCSTLSLDKEMAAVVFKSPPEISDSMKHSEIQDYLEYVLVGISTTAIFLSLILLSVLRLKRSERIFVHKNLLLSMGIGNLLYLLDKRLFTSREDHPVLCSTVTVIQHFLHTAVFTWMLVEGINLYIKLVKVFSVNRKYLTYLAIGWGIPAAIVGLVAAFSPSAYDMAEPILEDFMCGPLKLTLKMKRASCWLNGNLWIYKGPVLLVLLVNLALFVTILRVIFGKIASKYGEDNVQATRRGLRSIIALLPLLGVTWLLGFVTELHDALVYAFILLSSTQGVVFSIFHCILDDEVREAIRKLCAKKQRRPRATTLTESNPEKSDRGSGDMVTKKKAYHVDI